MLSVTSKVHTIHVINIPHPSHSYIASVHCEIDRCLDFRCQCHIVELISKSPIIFKTHSSSSVCWKRLILKIVVKLL